MAKVSKDACFHDLKTRILATDLPPGADLDEVTLTARYGISRTPLREVLHRLAGEGYIQITANRGAKVASMDLAVMRVFFQTAPMIYAGIARLAAENRNTAELERLSAAQARFVAATRAGDAAAAALCNHQFHEAIGAMAHNPYLSAALDRLLIDHARMSRIFYAPESAEERMQILKAVEQHDAMIAAFHARDAEGAVALTLAHWDLSRDRMERFVRPDPLPTDAPVDMPVEKDVAHGF